MIAEIPDTGPDEAGPTAEEARQPSERPAAPKASLARGIAVIEDALKTLPTVPGVYRMLNEAGDALYVGKAHNLRKRVAAYTQVPRLSTRLMRMVAETVSLEVISTHTEVEALLLESNLIKRLAPRYNILLRDDKSFPYILITENHTAPQITKHRGARKRKGDYFGPFASAGAVNRAITALEKAFLLRSCSDHMFASRTRPCLLYQIKRCSAPCVGRIAETDYATLVEQARQFLSGHSGQIQSTLATEMQTASATLDYERAARLRDRIRGLSQIQAHQDINIEGIEEADVIAGYQAGGQTCIEVFFFRNGGNYGNRAYFPSHDREAELPEILAAFIGQFYENKTPPRLLLLNETPAEVGLLAEALSLKADRRVEIAMPQRGAKRGLLDHALANAREALGRRMSENAAQRRLLEGLAGVFGLDGTPERIEVYDNSHLSGTNAYGAMVVAGPEGFTKSAYRRFAVTGRAKDGEDVEPGDDYAMLREVLARRFARALKEDPGREGKGWPDLVLIDGGQGQLNVALDALRELAIEDIPVVAIAKGPDRDAGRERFFMAGRPPMSLEPKDPVLYFLQRLRDEAHRFAIGTHRAGRSRAIGRSTLDDVPGIGAKRKKALLLHFGSARAVSRAGLADLAAVAGISEAVARRVYDHFHSEG
ncbi:MAG: excinuclease ABC subunit UvrC [Rhodospirillaceae bacterium]|nr:excinuclease ABC subunit UvrC [Rhodospirillaceae bacterium]